MMVEIADRDGNVLVAPMESFENIVLKAGSTPYGEQYTFADLFDFLEEHDTIEHKHKEMIIEWGLEANKLYNRGLTSSNYQQEKEELVIALQKVEDMTGNKADMGNFPRRPQSDIRIDMHLVLDSVYSKEVSMMCCRYLLGDATGKKQPKRSATKTREDASLKRFMEQLKN